MMIKSNNRWLPALLAILIAVPPQAPAAAVVSPVPEIGGAHVCYQEGATVTELRENCIIDKSEITGKQHIYPKIKWLEIDSRKITPEEIAALV